MRERGAVQERGSALDKALAVLEAIIAQSQPIGLPDLSARLDLPRQTVHRVLVQLEAAGLIVRDPSRDRFSVGPRLSTLALNALQTHNQSAPVRAILQVLVDDLEETCNIGVLDGLQFVYLERIECHWSLRVHLQAGSRVPAHCTSGGKVMLAHLDESVRARLLGSIELKAHTEHTITRVAALEADLAQVRTRGYAVNNQEFTIGIIGVAVPVADSHGRVLAALAVHGPAPRLDLQRAIGFVPRLDEAARAMARAWTGGRDAAGPTGRPAGRPARRRAAPARVGD
ncbi:MAG: IclR family transcriptional regulator [Hyphomicrobiaceae bacterium]|nr:IclR family transcriptional regulator [Hyphomicrobiaceae bacterium]